MMLLFLYFHKNNKYWYYHYCTTTTTISTTITNIQQRSQSRKQKAGVELPSEIVQQEDYWALVVKASRGKSSGKAGEK